MMRGCLGATAPQLRGAFGGVLAAASPTPRGGLALARKAIDGGSRHPKVQPQLGEAIQKKHAGCEHAAAWGQWGRQPSDPRPHCAAPPCSSRHKGTALPQHGTQLAGLAFLDCDDEQR